MKMNYSAAWQQKMHRLVWLVLLVASAQNRVFAQEDLLSGIDNSEEQKEHLTNAFKAPWVINQHSMEHVAGGVLDFRILHRFGRINEGIYEFVGLDKATMRLGLDYGITDRLTVGIGRSNNKKELDGFIKFRPIWQGRGKGSMPFSLILVTGITRDGLKWTNPDRKNYETSRLAYYHQLIIGRKFNSAFSFQLAPGVIHRNLVPNASDEHDIKFVGAGTRIKLIKRLALTADYVYVLPDQIEEIQNPLSIGFDIETGGHVFQLHFTNALGMNARSTITETTGDWGKGDIHFGFNISRVFTLSDKRKKPLRASGSNWK